MTYSKATTSWKAVVTFLKIAAGVLGAVVSVAAYADIPAENAEVGVWVGFLFALACGTAKAVENYRKNGNGDGTPVWVWPWNKAVSVLVIGLLAFGCATTSTGTDGTVTSTRVDIESVAQAIVLAQQVLPSAIGDVMTLWQGYRAEQNAGRVAQAEVFRIRLLAVMEAINAVADKDLDPKTKPVTMKVESISWTK